MIICYLIEFVAQQGFEPYQRVLTTEKERESMKSWQF